MMSIEAMKQALEALDAGPNAYLLMNTGGIANKLRQAIAEAEKQEPFAWMSNESAYRLKHGGNSKGAVPVHAKKSTASKIPLYTHPQQKQEPLTDEQRRAIILTADTVGQAIAMVEAAHGIKENT